MTIQKPKARIPGSQSYFMCTKDDDLIHNPFLTMSPSSETGSAFQPVSPPNIKRKVRNDFDEKSILATPKRNVIKSDENKVNYESPCDTTQTMSLQSLEQPQSSSTSYERQKKGRMHWGMSVTFKNHIKQIKSNLPNALKSMKFIPTSSNNKSSVELSDLAVATISLMPRHGGGIASGRMPFQRIRTSVMLHMIQDCKNSSWDPSVTEEMVDAKSGKASIAKLNVLLRNCIADEETCFVEKSQESVKIAKNTLEELNANGGQLSSLVKKERGRRNLICVKFLSGMYREVINDEANVPSRDGLSLMIVASSYYAIGKFGPALSVYQRAGIEMKKEISDTSPGYANHCAKLFNNMGCVYFEMQKYEKAMQTFQRALQLFHNDYEDDYVSWVAAILDQAAIMNNMAYILIKFKQYDDASDLIDASFELQQILPNNTDSTMTIATLSTMAYIYYRTKKYRLSLDTYTACVQLQDKNPMYNESDHVEVLKRMADICKKIKDHEKRIYLLRCVVVYQQCYLLEDDDEVWETHAALAESLQAFADAGGTQI